MKTVMKNSNNPTCPFPLSEQMPTEVLEGNAPYEPLPWEEEYLRPSQPLPTTLAPDYTSDFENPYLNELS